MTDFALRFGYVGLFIVTFLGSSLLPIPSELVVVPMPSFGYNTWVVLLVATAGNTLGSLLNYYMGKKGTDFILARYITVPPEKVEQAKQIFKKWGTWALFFAWLPFIGDPLTLVAGVFHVEIKTFLFWVTTGKFLRYVVLLGLVNQILRFMGR